MKTPEILNIKNFIEKINPKNNKVIFFSLVIFIFIIIFIIVLANIGRIKKEKNIPVFYEKQDKNKIFLFTPDADDLKIPKTYLKNPEFIWRSFRITPYKWEKEEVERFWKDPVDVIIEVYSEENKEYIKNILGGVP